ncbi:2,4-dienoyl-CoA reductase [Halovenus aranensis]|jgi:2,4-dienoyl-CoA reductase-like NADH-dependent reductase (Old Yellow Enzyme family)|uniref:2,4-dienoyl-CoA reductase n=1 Tax=Halovenus aranensis TaxID=890420 RepID=A0A1G8XKC0_9EURY|nr:NADH:flavin oxidoreductase [Halovenus aranensis]SDJ90345.1 2,4-dienoyl-CoA reductase [Halovenus aranensis]
MLFDSTSLQGLTLDNRVGLAPMTRVSATADGCATDEMAQYYAKFADGGFAFLVTEGVYTDSAYSKGYLNQPGLVTDDQVDAWEQVVDAVHDAGSPIFAQLMHCGAQNQGMPPSEPQETIAPSPVQPEAEKSEAYGGSGSYPVPEQATHDDLETAREGFVSAATNAAEAGFDGVEIHGANGYFLNEFLSSTMNQRDDEYGGDPEARVRYPAEVVSAIAEAVPEDFVVGIRVSQTMVTDTDHQWDEGEDAAAVFFEELSAAGAEFIHTTEPDATVASFGEDGLTLAKAAVEYVTDDTVVIANGGLGTPAAARSALEDGADLLTLATGALANPDWPQRVADGDELTEFDYREFLRPEATISEHELTLED